MISSIVARVTLLALHILARLHYLYILSYNLVLSAIRQQDTIIKPQDLKIPKHIVLSFTNELRYLNLISIARLISWCQQLEIEQITLYDECGKLKDLRKELIYYLKKSNQTNKQEANLDNVLILSKQDGRQLFAELSQNIVRHEPEAINPAMIDSYLGWNSDPDLLVIFGTPICLYGLPPWQLRLTEIISLPSHISLPQETFIRCLKQFSKIEQRIGS